MLYARRFPEKIAGFMGVGQPSTLEAETRAYEFVLSEARRRRDRGALAKLEAIGPPPYTHEDLHVRDHLLYRYGGYTHARLTLTQGMRRMSWYKMDRRIQNTQDFSVLKLSTFCQQPNRTCSNLLGSVVRPCIFLQNR